MEGSALLTSVEERLEREIEQERNLLQRANDRLVNVERETEELAEREKAAWQKYEATGESDEDLRQEWESLADDHSRSVRVMQQTLDAITKYEREILMLQQPEELERRKLVSAKMAGIRREYTIMAEDGTEKTVTKKPTARDRGVPDVYLNDAGNFKIGMDARYKSDLVNAALGIENEAALMSFEPADAEKRLAEREWTSFLDRKKEIIAEKEAKAQERATAREQAARERAEAKAEAKAAKDAEKAEKAAAGAAAEAKAEGQALPDPKPESSKRRR